MTAKRAPVVEVIDDQVAEILRGKTEVERLMIGFGMMESGRIILRAAITSENPSWNEEQINREIARRFSAGAVPNGLE